MRRQRIVCVMAGILILVAGLAAHSRVDADDKARDIVYEMRGYVVAPRTVTVCPNIAGHITQVFISEGQLVKAGDLLARLRATEQEAGLKLARAELHLAELKVQSAKSGTATAVGIAEAELEIAKSKLELAQARLEGTILRAPFAGTVANLRAEAGALVDPRPGPGAIGSICDIVDLKSAEIEVDVPERDAAKIKVGMPCRIRIDAYPDREFTGQVSRMGPNANRAKGTIGGRIRLTLPDGESRILPEMTAIVAMLSAKR